MPPRYEDFDTPTGYVRTWPNGDQQDFSHDHRPVGPMRSLPRPRPRQAEHRARYEYAAQGDQNASLGTMRVLLVALKAEATRLYGLDGRVVSRRESERLRDRISGVLRDVEGMIDLGGNGGGDSDRSGSSSD